MALPRVVASPSPFSFLIGAHTLVLRQVAWHYRPTHIGQSTCTLRSFSTTPRVRQQQPQQQRQASSAPSDAHRSPPSPESTSSNFALPLGWEDDPQLNQITHFSDLPHRHFGYNQHIKINEDFKESLRQILWNFRAPIRYAFAYGSGVFGQAGPSPKPNPGVEEWRHLSPHPDPPQAVMDWQRGGAKVIDFIFGVSHTQHWHSLNLTQHADHYSFLQYLPYKSAAISWIQDSLGAGVYFNPYITVNGVLIKYGVVSLDTLATDLSNWSTLYLAGRLQKPVKILRDDPRIRLANQINLLSALRTALLMLPEQFTERQLYEKITGLSYMGDPRMLYIPGLGASENMAKVHNIVGAQLPGFRQLYVPLIETLPNVRFADSRTPNTLAWEKDDAVRHTGSNVELDAEVLGGKDGLTLSQDMHPDVRGNMVRRLPRGFRNKLYWQYKRKFGIPGSAFDEIISESDSTDRSSSSKSSSGVKKSTSSSASTSSSPSSVASEASEFEQRIASQDDLSTVVAKCVQGIVQWPATSQTIKSFFTAGVLKAWRYYRDKRKRSREGNFSSTGKTAEEGKENGEKEVEKKEK